ncbi:hypothetical protein [Prochlorothrix hollandica]|uniref:hypothetical protein n=1 Tax=Prochlorothrix hollandica TaxID=1223 RepID=UPI00034B0683|nr:hypothetical protein [Prochlorothrix hollandica]
MISVLAFAGMGLYDEPRQSVPSSAPYRYDKIPRFPGIFLHFFCIFFCIVQCLQPLDRPTPAFAAHRLEVGHG